MDGTHWCKALGAIVLVEENVAGSSPSDKRDAGKRDAAWNDQGKSYMSFWEPNKGSCWLPFNINSSRPTISRLRFSEGIPLSELVWAAGTMRTMKAVGGMGRKQTQERGTLYISAGSPLSTQRACFKFFENPRPLRQDPQHPLMVSPHGKARLNME